MIKRITLSLVYIALSFYAQNTWASVQLILPTGEESDRLEEIQSVEILKDFSGFAWFEVRGVEDGINRSLIDSDGSLTLKVVSAAFQQREIFRTVRGEYVVESLSGTKFNISRLVFAAYSAR